MAAEGPDVHPLLLSEDHLISADLYWFARCFIKGMTPASVDEPMTSVSSVPARTRRSMVSALVLIAIGAAIASLGYGGLLYYFVRSGRLSVRGTAKAHAAPTKIETHLVTLDPLLVNLAGDSGNSYLRLSMALQMEDTRPTKGVAQKNNQEEEAAQLRDAALKVLGEQSADSLLAAGGKDHLKLELKKAFEGQGSGLKVEDVLFTDFLVQH